MGLDYQVYRRALLIEVKKPELFPAFFLRLVIFYVIFMIKWSNKGVICIISFFVHFFMMIGIMLSSFYVFVKSIQYIATVSRKVLIAAWCFLWAVLYAAAPYLMPLPLVNPLACLASIIFVFFLTKKKLEIVISAYLLSFGIGNIMYSIASFIIAFVSVFFMSGHTQGSPLAYNQSIYILLYALTALLQLFIAFLIFRIRRIRKGFPFIFKKYTIVVALVFTGIVLIFTTWLNTNAESANAYIGYLYVAGVIIAGVGIYIMVRRLIKMFQRKRTEQNAADYYEKLANEYKEKYERLLEIDKARHTEVHKIIERIEAMELAYKDGAGGAYEDVKAVKNEFVGGLAKINDEPPLPPTKVGMIDILFTYFLKKCAEDNIAFGVAVNGSIIYMVDNVIEKGRLETLISTHVKDARIAVNASDNKIRRIMVMIGLSGDGYELTVLDSGVPFTVDTLARLGTERVTTHAGDGGSGIGFMTTFETMREYNASLIIKEEDPTSAADFTKSVTIRFDGKNQYIIETYRPGDFPASDRYSVYELQGAL